MNAAPRPKNKLIEWIDDQLAGKEMRWLMAGMILATSGSIGIKRLFGVDAPPVQLEAKQDTTINILRQVSGTVTIIGLRQDNLEGRVSAHITNDSLKDAGNRHSWSVRPSGYSFNDRLRRPANN